MSQTAYETDTRFGKAADWVARLEQAAGREVLHTIVQAEPIGPKGLVDAMVVCPCTGNTLSKIAAGITDTPVTMAVKSALRIGIPVVLCCATNDAMAASGPNLLRLLNTKNVYLVPLRQDDPVKSPSPWWRISPCCPRPSPWPWRESSSSPCSCRRTPAPEGRENFFIYKIPVLGYDKGYHSRAAPGCGLFVKRTREYALLYKMPRACQDSAAKCPNCKSSKLRPVAEEDLVLLHRADQYTAGLLEKRFQEQGLSYRMEPFQGGRISYLYEGT